MTDHVEREGGRESDREKETERESEGDRDRESFELTEIHSKHILKQSFCFLLVSAACLVQLRHTESLTACTVQRAILKRHQRCQRCV